MRIARLGDSILLSAATVQELARQTQKFNGEHRAQLGKCTCKEMEEGAHAHRASKLEPSNDNGIRIIKWEPQSKPGSILAEVYIYKYMFRGGS